MTNVPVYTECIHCDKIIEVTGEYDSESDDIYITCPFCKQEIVIWNWFGEVE